MEDRLTYIEPLCVDRHAGAQLCGVSVDTWDRWRQKGILPSPIPGTDRWFVEQIRLFLRKQCGMTDALPPLPNRGNFKDVGKNALRAKKDQRGR